jgi:hypothetical protein
MVESTLARYSLQNPPPYGAGLPDMAPLILVGTDRRDAHPSGPRPNVAPSLLATQTTPLSSLFVALPLKAQRLAERVPMPEMAPPPSPDRCREERTGNPVSPPPVRWRGRAPRRRVPPLRLARC